MGMIFILIVIVVIIIIVMGIAKRNKGQYSKPENMEPEAIQEPRPQKPEHNEIGNEYEHLDVRPGYKLFKMEDVRHRDLPIELVGNFTGKAVAETGNKYDPNAIGIYNDEGLCLGFLPKGNEWLYDYINLKGGEVKAYGLLGYDEGMFGRVCVETGE